MLEQNLPGCKSQRRPKFRNLTAADFMTWKKVPTHSAWNKNLPQIRRRVTLTCCCFRSKVEFRSNKQNCSHFGELFGSVGCKDTKKIQNFVTFSWPLFFSFKMCLCFGKVWEKIDGPKYCVHSNARTTLSSHTPTHTHTHTCAWGRILGHTHSLSHPPRTPRHTHTHTDTRVWVLLRTTNPPQATLYSSETPDRKKQTS